MNRKVRFLLNIRKEVRKARLKKLLRLNNTISLGYDIGIANHENLMIEDYVHLGANTKIHARGGVKIGRGTIFGPNVTIYSANHNFRNALAIPYDSTYINKPVTIGQNVWIGGGVIIVPGANIGEGSIIGAGTVVSGNIEKYSIVIGNPCQIVGKRDEKEYLDLKEKDQIFIKKRIGKL